MDIRNNFNITFLKRLIAIAVSLIFFWVSSCKTSNSFSLVANNQPLEKRAWENLGKVTTEASNFSLFHIATVTDYNQIENAIAEAVAEKNGDALIDISYHLEVTYWPIGTVRLLRIKGTVIRYK